MSVRPVALPCKDVRSRDFLLLAVLVLTTIEHISYVDVFILTAFPSTPGYRHIKTQHNTVVQKTPVCLIARERKFCRVAPKMFSIIIVVSIAHKKKVSVHMHRAEIHISTYNSGVHRSLQNCGFSVWNLRHVTVLAPRIWRCLLNFWTPPPPIKSVTLYNETFVRFFGQFYVHLG